MNSPKHLYQAIQQSPHRTAVFVFAHGLERLSMYTETLLQEQQLQKLLRDYARQLVGIYDQSVSLEDLTGDIQSAQEGLL
jgi:uncharacterized protein with von Willebrand factor type A (vWA) domain